MITRLCLPVLFLLCAGCAPMMTAEQLELREVQARATQAKSDAHKLEAREAAEAREREQKAKEEAVRRFHDRTFLATQSGKITRSQGLALSRNKVIEVYGAIPPYEDELLTFTIAMWERVEAGLLTQAGSDSLVAQKQSEIHQRVMNEQAAQEAIEEQDRARQRALTIERLQAEEQAEANEQANRLNLLNLWLHRPRR